MVDWHLQVMVTSMVQFRGRDLFFMIDKYDYSQKETVVRPKWK